MNVACDNPGLLFMDAPSILAAMVARTGPDPRQSYLMLAGVVALLTVRRIWRNRRSPLKMTANLLGLSGLLAGFFAILYMKGYSLEARMAVITAVGAIEAIALALRLWSYRKTPRALLIFISLIAVLTAAHFGLQAATGKPFNDPSLALAVLLLGLYLTLVIWFAVLVYNQRRAVANLSGLAARLGWQMEIQRRYFGLLRMHILVGHHRGREVRFNAFTPPNPKKKRKWAGVVASLPAGRDLLLVLTPKVESGRPAPNKNAAISDLATGDPDVDQAFRVQSNNTEIARKIFPSEIRRKLLDLRRQGREAFILGVRGGKAFYATPGSYASSALVDRLAQRIDLVGDFADAAEQARG